MNFCQLQRLAFSIVVYCFYEDFFSSISVSLLWLSSHHLMILDVHSRHLQVLILPIYLWAARNLIKLLYKQL